MHGRRYKGKLGSTRRNNTHDTAVALRAPPRNTDRRHKAIDRVSRTTIKNSHWRESMALSPIAHSEKLNLSTGSIHRDRLPFRLPPFSRITWVDTAAQNHWGTTFKAISSELAKVTSPEQFCCSTHCCLTTIVPFEYFKLQQSLISGFNIQVIGETWPSHLEPLRRPNSDAATKIIVVIGPGEIVLEFARAWGAYDWKKVLILLGWPNCCAEQYINWQISGPWLDLCWHTASHSEVETFSENTLVFKKPWPRHSLLRSLGLVLYDHIPCSSECLHTEALGSTRLDLLRQIGLDDVADSLVEILRWPIEWTSLHGIAEIKTPLCKISTATDSLARKYTVRIHSSCYPVGSPSGVVFPFMPPGHLRVSNSRSFQRGIENQIDNRQTIRDSD